VHLMCVFHYFRIFSGFIVCIFRGVKNYGSGGWGPLNAGGPCALHNLHNLLLRHCMPMHAPSAVHQEVDVGDEVE